MEKNQPLSHHLLPPLLGAWPTQSPHPGFVPQLTAVTQLQGPGEVQGNNNVLSRERRRKKASGFEIGGREK